MKKYNCPFCNERYYRDNLVKHLEKEHDDELPLDYTPYRMMYDIVNNKPGHGTCTVCGKPTKWNEKTQKYHRLCGDPKCYEAVKKTYEKRMLRVYNKVHLLDDPKQQEKMLANRRISGKYKWSDGRIFTYTGQYEKSLLEFLDTVMNYDSQDIIAPGPVLEYKYKGKTHHWITDFLIIPYNLIIEVKDGGDNPNNRSMPEYRAKQIAKEKMVTDMGTYSYIRLTNNDFSQLLGILAELKMKVVDNESGPLYRIHEDYFDTIDYIADTVITKIISEEFSYPSIEVDETRYLTEKDNEDTFYVLAEVSSLDKVVNKSNIQRLEEIADYMSSWIDLYYGIPVEYIYNEDDHSYLIGLNLD